MGTESRNKILVLNSVDTADKTYRNKCNAAI